MRNTIYFIIVVFFQLQLSCSTGSSWKQNLQLPKFNPERIYDPIAKEVYNSSLASIIHDPSDEFQYLLIINQIESAEGIEFFRSHSYDLLEKRQLTVVELNKIKSIIETSPADRRSLFLLLILKEKDSNLYNSIDNEKKAGILYNAFNDTKIFNGWLHPEKGLEKTSHMFFDIPELKLYLFQDYLNNDTIMSFSGKSYNRKKKDTFRIKDFAFHVVTNDTPTSPFISNKSLKERDEEIAGIQYQSKISISGKVIGLNNNGLNEVMLLQDGDIFNEANFNGDFSISVKPGKLIIFEKAGYHPLKRSFFKNEDSIIIKLHPK